jgi:hypothetical protein
MTSIVSVRMTVLLKCVALPVESLSGVRCGCIDAIGQSPLTASNYWTGSNRINRRILQQDKNEPKRPQKLEARSL